MLRRPQTDLTARTTLRGATALLAFALVMLLPASAGAQVPGVGGYAGTAPDAVEGSAPPAPVQPSAEPAAAAQPQAQVAPARVVSAPSTKTLPFTGLQIAFIVAAGLSLIGLGLALRQVSGRALTGI